MYIFFSPKARPNQQITQMNAALHLVRMEQLVSTDTMTTSVYVKVATPERTVKQVSEWQHTGRSKDRTHIVSLVGFVHDISMIEQDRQKDRHRQIYRQTKVN